MKSKCLDAFFVMLASIDRKVVGGECLKDPMYGFVSIRSLVRSNVDLLRNFDGKELHRWIREGLLGLSITAKSL